MAISRDIVINTDRRDRRTPLEGDRHDPVATLAAALPQAIERDDIAVRFQPQVHISDDRVTGVEALARWDHPLLGPIDADLLFAAADLAQLAGRLSEHVQRIALAEVARWPALLCGLDVSLNVTAGDLANQDFAAAMLKRIADRGLPAGRVCVEVTESALIADLPAAAAALQTLRHAGMRIALDDVGAGYAGFSYLKALPLDRFKIDKSMTVDIVENAKARALVRGMIALADALGLDVTAEGIETEAQRAFLASERCGWYQGFLCAGALDTSALTGLVKDRARRS